MRNPVALFYSSCRLIFCRNAPLCRYNYVKTKVCRERQKPPDPGILLAVPDAREMYYLEPVTGSVCRFPDPVFGFCGNIVHHYKKYRFKWLFLQNNPFNRDLILLFIGPLLTMFFDT